MLPQLPDEVHGEIRVGDRGKMHERRLHGRQVRHGEVPGVLQLQDLTLVDILGQVDGAMACRLRRRRDVDRYACLANRVEQMRVSLGHPRDHGDLLVGPCGRHRGEVDRASEERVSLAAEGVDLVEGDVPDEHQVIGQCRQGRADLALRILEDPHRAEVPIDPDPHAILQLLGGLFAARQHRDAVLPAQHRRVAQHPADIDDDGLGKAEEGSPRRVRQIGDQDGTRTELVEIARVANHAHLSLRPRREWRRSRTDRRQARASLEEGTPP